MTKTAITVFILSLLLLAGGYTPIEEPYHEHKPVFMTREVLEKSVEMLPPREMVKTGKIYVHGNYLFVNERYKGIHVVDNSLPANPKKEGFIRIPGCIDMAVKGEVVYADNAVDLIAIDVSNMKSIKVTKRNSDIFPELTPPNTDVVPQKYNKANRPANTIIVEWVEDYYQEFD
ncbi:MAG: hypothetical protein HC896_17380 [Bacteroidales bacterium]|nr:hypothetical protein [Bacteroidales bacterium]